MTTRWRIRIARLYAHRCERGAAALEFGLALPLLLTLGLGGIEVANYAIAHLKVSNIAMTTADNAARIRDAIDEADINDLFLGAELAGASIEFKQKGRVILYDVEKADEDRQWIRWQRCMGSKAIAPTYGRPMKANGTEIKNGTEIYKTDRKTASGSDGSADDAFTMTEIGPDDRKIAAQGTTAIMFVEAHYDYVPLVSNPFTSSRTITYSSAFNVRQRNDHLLKNANKIAPLSCG